MAKNRSKKKSNKENNCTKKFPNATSLVWNRKFIEWEEDDKILKFPFIFQTRKI